MKRHIISWVFFLMMTSTSIWGVKYEIIDIHPSSAYESAATGINEHGDVVGWLKNSASESFGEVFFYSKEKKHHYVNFKSLTSPVVNSQGKVGGTLITKGALLTLQFPFIWSVEKGVESIKIPEGWEVKKTYLQDISFDGDILLTDGLDRNTSTKVGILTEKEFHPVAELNFGRRFNKINSVAGSMMKDGKPYPALYDYIYMKTKIVAPEASGETLAVNLANEMIGLVYDGEIPIGFIYSHLLFGLVPLPQFIPVDINIHPHVIGYQIDENNQQHPMLWSQKAFVPLQSLIDSEDELIKVTAMNDDGLIVGSMKSKKDGKEHAVLLRPL